MSPYPTFPADEGGGNPTPEEVRRLIDDATRLDHFFVAPSGALIREYRPGEEIPWEIFRGHLLDGRQTRSRRTFESWNLFWEDETGKSDEPILSVKWDAAAGELHVTRGLLCYVWEPYDAGDNVIETRRASRWLRELVGTVCVRSCTTAALHGELSRLLFQAVVGVSRLPLTSVEAPLPGFSLGRLAYFSRAEGTDANPLQDTRALIRKALVSEFNRLERVKWLESVMRSVRAEGVADAARLVAERWQEIGEDAASLHSLLRSVFVEVALSPYTDFVDNVLALVRALVDQHFWTVADQIDFLAALLRQTGRHLSAYDLITFHHNGANYPDALLLDAVLKSCLRLAETHPELWLAGPADDAGHKRRNRRGLRQGWIIRRFYEGHPVPDAPTSPGENARVMPAPFAPVPDEQIFMPHRRRKRLFEGDPLPRHLGENASRVLRQSVEDLNHLAELRELGMALFLDRPFGVAKEALEPDRTMLLSYEAFSRTLAEKRLGQLARNSGIDLPAAAFEAFRTALRDMPGEGVPVPRTPGRPRPVVSLQDAFKAADDFVLLSTTRATVRDFLDQHDLTPLHDRFNFDYLVSGMLVLLLGGTNERGEPVLRVYDARWRRRLELKVCLEHGYFSRRGVEFPRGGLQVLLVWEGEPERKIDVRGERLLIRPRGGQVEACG